MDEPDRIDLAEDAIDRLYQKVADLLRSGANQREIGAAYEELRAVQQEEAERITTLLEAQLEMPPDQGKKALETVEKLIAQYEDSSSANPASEPADEA